jgi:hypothetical protein
MNRNLNQSALDSSALSGCKREAGVGHLRLIPQCSFWLEKGAGRARLTPMSSPRKRESSNSTCFGLGLRPRNTQASTTARRCRGIGSPLSRELCKSQKTDAQPIAGIRHTTESTPWGEGGGEGVLTLGDVTSRLNSDSVRPHPIPLPTERGPDATALYLCKAFAFTGITIVRVDRAYTGSRQGSVQRDQAGLVGEHIHPAARHDRRNEHGGIQRHLRADVAGARIDAHQ